VTINMQYQWPIIKWSWINNYWDNPIYWKMNKIVLSMWMIGTIRNLKNLFDNWENEYQILDCELLLDCYGYGCVYGICMYVCCIYTQHTYICGISYNQR